MTTAVPDPSDDFKLYLPDWATGTTTSWCVGAQLRTKDGRRLGNAVIASYRLGKLSPWEVVTDAGTTLRLDEAELDELFWPPSWVMDVATSPGIRARAALAQPEPEGVTGEAWQEFIEQVQHVQHVASREGEGPRFDLVECALALWREAIPQAPEPEGVTDEQWDAIKERLWDKYETVGYQGERFMYQGDFDTALDVARKDLARWALPTIEPVPVAERPWEREGWCDVEGRCWWWHPETDSHVACWCHSRGNGTEKFWLPHHALPIPTTH
jgi:hypothetical protein